MRVLTRWQNVALCKTFHTLASLVMAPFSLRSSLRSGGLGPTRGKMGPSPPERSRERRKNGTGTGLYNGS